MKEYSWFLLLFFACFFFVANGQFDYYNELVESESKNITGFCNFEENNDDDCPFEWMKEPGSSAETKWTVHKASDTPGLDLPKEDSSGNGDGFYAFVDYESVTHGQGIDSVLAIMATELTIDQLPLQVSFDLFLFGTITPIPRLIAKVIFHKFFYYY